MGKQLILIDIQDSNENKIDVVSFDNGAKNVYINARSKEDALSLLSCEIDAIAVPFEDTKHADNKHYVSYSKSIEEMEAEAENYENVPAGRKLVSSIENAKDFYFKHSKGGLTVSQIGYLANKHKNSLLNGSMDIIALSYRRGYLDGKANSASRAVKKSSDAVIV